MPGHHHSRQMTQSFSALYQTGSACPSAHYQTVNVLLLPIILSWSDCHRPLFIRMTLPVLSLSYWNCLLFIRMTLPALFQIVTVCSLSKRHCLLFSKSTLPALSEKYCLLLIWMTLPVFSFFFKQSSSALYQTVTTGSLSDFHRLPFSSSGCHWLFFFYSHRLLLIKLSWPSFNQNAIV